MKQHRRKDSWTSRFNSRQSPVVRGLGGMKHKRENRKRKKEIATWPERHLPGTWYWNLLVPERDKEGKIEKCWRYNGQAVCQLNEIINFKTQNKQWSEAKQKSKFEKQAEKDTEAPSQYSPSTSGAAHPTERGRSRVGFSSEAKQVQRLRSKGSNTRKG